MDPFLKLWIGGDFHVMASEVGRIALFGFWANGVAYVPFAQIEARGHARRAAVVIEMRACFIVPVSCF